MNAQKLSENPINSKSEWSESSQTTSLETPSTSSKTEKANSSLLPQTPKPRKRSNGTSNASMTPSMKSEPCTLSSSSSIKCQKHLMIYSLSLRFLSSSGKVSTNLRVWATYWTTLTKSSLSSAIRSKSSRILSRSKGILGSWRWILFLLMNLALKIQFGILKDLRICLIRELTLRLWSLERLGYPRIFVRMFMWSTSFILMISRIRLRLSLENIRTRFLSTDITIMWRMWLKIC